MISSDASCAVILLVAVVLLAGMPGRALADTGDQSHLQNIPTLGEGGTLSRNGEPYRAIGVNYFDAFLRRLHNPDDTSYREGFAELAKRKIPFARFAACGFWPADMALYTTDKEAYFERMDDVVRAAEEHGIGLIPSLFWYDACLPDLVGEPRGQWGNPDSKTIAFMRQYVDEMVSRYVNSPAIWAWEFGNEYDLAADLPNASEHRPWIVPDQGTATARSEADDVRFAMIETAFKEFGKAVRQHDPHRLITTGNSIPRPTAHHQRTELQWATDTRDEFIAMLIDSNPDPMGLISIHLYPGGKEKRFEQNHTTYAQILDACHTAALRAGKCLFVGEFGAGDVEGGGGPDRVRRENLSLLNAIERSRVPLAALWVFDFAHQGDSFSVTPTNDRKYLLDALEGANERIRSSAGRIAHLSNGVLTGYLLDNRANAGRAGSGFNPLYHASFPEQNLFSDALVGLNFEHIFNGMAADKDISSFTPRKDPCRAHGIGPSLAKLTWPAEGSAWNMDCEMTYALAPEGAVDMTFQATPREEPFGLGYAAMMWASYMNHARGRTIHFYGMNNGEEGWITFGEDTADGFETGTIRHDGVEPLPYEQDAKTLNIIEHPTKTFLLPFYYGLVDGDGDPGTTEDTMAYIMMFDQCEAIRFAMWNFNTTIAGEPDPHGPAWDWQFVIRDPEPSRTYQYRARMAYVPFEGPDAVKERYLAWRESLESTE